MARIFAAVAALVWLAGCQLIVPLYDEKEAILASLDDPQSSFISYMQVCPARDDLFYGSLLAPLENRKLKGIGFVWDGTTGYFAPHRLHEMDGDLLANRYYAKMIECEFEQLVPARPDKPDRCFGTYCPCKGEFDSDRFMCQLTRQKPDHFVFGAPPEKIEAAGLIVQQDYAAALQARETENTADDKSERDPERDPG